MDIFSLHNQIKVNKKQNLFDLFEPTMIYRNDIPTEKYLVTTEDEMRCDILMKNIYNIDYTLLESFLIDCDVLLFINNIINPLNIKEGMIIEYPISIESFSEYRYTSEDNSYKNDILNILAFPNYMDKTTRTDSNRQNYIENNYSLSPVLLENPRNPVTIQNGIFTIGGL